MPEAAEILEAPGPLALQLSSARRQVVGYRSGDLQVSARAGSGKTEWICRRILTLLEEGVGLAHPVAFSFTEKTPLRKARRG